MSTNDYAFANVLFAGPCNRRCPWCIGAQLPDHVNVDNLDEFPPRGLDAFVDEVRAHRVPEVVFTGTVSDPQLYRHERALLTLLRERLDRATRFSVHTNGVLALRKIDVLNAYDRACISFPSFEPATYIAMMGRGRPPDLAAILAAARIPVKVSCVVDTPNAGEIDAFLARCRTIGVARVVLRRLFGASRWPAPVLEGRAPVRTFAGNPVYDLDGMEVTVWEFEATAMRSLNLFADGTLGRSYLLTDAVARRLPIAS